MLRLSVVAQSDLVLMTVSILRNVTCDPLGTLKGQFVLILGGL